MTYPHNSEFSVSDTQLMAHLAEIESAKDEVSSASGDLRSTIKRILEDAGYEKGALQIVRDLDALSDTKLADRLRTLWPMLDAMRPHWEERIRDMLDRKASETDDMDADMQGGA